MFGPICVCKLGPKAREAIGRCRGETKRRGQGATSQDEAQPPIGLAPHHPLPNPGPKTTMCCPGFKCRTQKQTENQPVQQVAVPGQLPIHSHIKRSLSVVCTNMMYNGTRSIGLIWTITNAIGLTKAIYYCLEINKTEHLVGNYSLLENI